MAKERAELLKKQAKEEMLARARAEADACKELSMEARQKICRDKRNKIKRRLAECRKELEEQRRLESDREREDACIDVDITDAAALRQEQRTSRGYHTRRTTWECGDMKKRDEDKRLAIGDAF